MRDPERIDQIIDYIRDEWKKPGNQDQRLGQLIANLSPDRVRSQCGMLFNLEDTYWQEKARVAQSAD